MHILHNISPNERQIVMLIKIFVMKTVMEICRLYWFLTGDRMK